MTQPLNLGNCCGPSIPGIRRITLPDGDQVGLVGLDAVMEALCKEGRLPDDSTVMEMIARLREKNYISYSSLAQELYQKVRFGMQAIQLSPKSAKSSPSRSNTSRAQ